MSKLRTMMAAATTVSFLKKVTLGSPVEVPHVDITPNHKRHLDEVMKQAKEKRNRKISSQPHMS